MVEELDNTYNFGYVESKVLLWDIWEELSSVQVEK